MFPSQTTVSSTSQLDSTTSVSSSGKSPEFDFETGDFVVVDGKVQTVTGLSAVKQWIKKVFKTEKNKYKIYNTTNTDKYGVALLELITSKYPTAYIQAQVQTIITEALLKNSDITAVNDFSFTKDKNLLNVDFTVTTIYGTSTESVVI